MKIKFYYLFALVLMLCTSNLLCSCSNDNDENPEETTEEVKLNDVDFVRKNLVSVDANGNFNGMLWGVFLDESIPTTAYVSVETLEEAKALWEKLIPYDAVAQVQDSGEFVVLTDENGVKQGEMRFNVLDNGRELAEIVFSSADLIDAHVNRLVFIPSALWPNNDEIDIDMPRIMVRKTTGEKYAVMCLPTTQGIPGFIIHVGEKRYINSREHEKGNAVLMKGFPTRSSLNVIAVALDNKPELWNLLSEVSGQTVDVLKQARFFTSRTDQANDYMFSLTEHKEYNMAPLPFNFVANASSPNYAGFWHYPSRVYLITVVDGKVQLTMDNVYQKVPADMEREINLTMDDFSF